MAKDLFCKGRLKIADSLLGEIGFFAGRVDHHMHMGMIALIVIGGIPFQICQRDLHVLRNGFSLRAQEVSPSIGVVVAKAGRILPTQRNDMRPHIAVVICDLRRHLRMVDRYIRIGK